MAPFDAGPELDLDLDLGSAEPFDGDVLDQIESEAQPLPAPLPEAAAEAYRDRYAEGLQQLRERFGADR